MWKRVITPVALLVTLWVVMGLATTCLISMLSRAETVPFAENVTTIEAAARMEAVLLEIAAAGSANNPAAQATLAELEATFQQHLAEAETTSFTPEEKVLVAKIQEKFSEYRIAVDRRGRAGTASAASAQETMQLALAVLEPCVDLIRVNEHQLDLAAVRSAQIKTYVVLIWVVFFLTGPIVGVVSGYWVARGLHRSISQISVTLKDAASDLEHEGGRVELRPWGDLPELHQQIVAFAGRIKQVADELHQARQGVAQTTRLAAVGELAAGLAHELRNPLASVKLLVQTAGQNSGRAMTEQQLYVIQDEIVRMERIVQEFLDFAGPPAPSRIRHDLRDTLQRALNLVSGRAKQQRITLSWELPSAPMMIDADPEQLQQVFVNLLLNGIESMVKDGSLEVTVQPDEKDRNLCRVLFSDSGPGIAREMLGRLFEPFTTTKEHGTGLGLAVSRRIVEEHGGAMSAANRRERGAVFSVELPLCPA